MASLNKVILIGNLGADPETRYAPSGDAICNLRLATTETWKDRNSGERKENTEWHRVVFFGKLAEIAGQYLRKGSQIYVEGRIQTRKWQDKEGQDRYTTEVVLQGPGATLTMLDSRAGGGAGGSRGGWDEGGKSSGGGDWGGEAPDRRRFPASGGVEFARGLVERPAKLTWLCPARNARPCQQHAARGIEG